MKSSDKFRNVLLRPNQTVGQIANKYYGDPTRWRDIIDANPDFPFLEDRIEDVILRVPLDEALTLNSTSIEEATNILFNTPNATL